MITELKLHSLPINLSMLVTGTQDALILHPDKRVMVIPPVAPSSAASASHGVEGGKNPEDHTLNLKREDAFRRLREALEAFCASSSNRSSAAASMYTVISPPGHPSASATARTIGGFGAPSDRGGFYPARYRGGGGGGGPDLMGGGGWAGGGRWSSYMDEEAENIVPPTVAPRGINRDGWAAASTTSGRGSAADAPPLVPRGINTDGWAAASSAAVRSHPTEDPTKKKQRSFSEYGVFEHKWKSGVERSGGNSGTAYGEGGAAVAPPASSCMGPPSVWAAAPPSSRPTLRAMRKGSGGRGHTAREGGPRPRRPAGKAVKPEGRARRIKAMALTGLGRDAVACAVGVGSERVLDRQTTTAASVSGIEENVNEAVCDVMVCVLTDGTDEVEGSTAGSSSTSDISESSSGISSDGISIDRGAVGKGTPAHCSGTATAVTRGWGRPRAAPVFALGGGEGPSGPSAALLVAFPSGAEGACLIARKCALRQSPPGCRPTGTFDVAAAATAKQAMCSDPTAEAGDTLPLARTAVEAAAGADLPVDPSDPHLDLAQDRGGVPGAWWSSGDGIAMEDLPSQKRAAPLWDSKRRGARDSFESLSHEAVHDVGVPSLRSDPADGGGVPLVSENSGRWKANAKVRSAIESFVSEVCGTARVGLVYSMQ